MPDAKILIPRVIDSTTNFVEHPRVIAGADCGFSTFAFVDNPVTPSIVWAKLAALAEGARIATTRL